ncbi:hypothetical protein LWF01_03055 [Saxibacter everestensis]|uniref:Holin n=1 Tax=Saxibacter everestensis TaxID=2909229 RepID=A0ABY8QV19_9MICO|nr:hypothetical protein LWF01_03055 [Brevibacteriaceae bacterium ZFBP1038]
MATNTSISPKVIATAGTTIGLTVLVAMLEAITPELLSFAGPWATVLYMGVIALAGTLAGYVTRDPDRETGHVPDV